MSTLIHELENNEAVLLMYLADELPAEDRAEVEQMLASDGNLRMELQEIRSGYVEAMATVATLDELQPVSSSAESIAVRRAGRAMQQWNVDRLRAVPETPQKKGLRYPGWVYPSTAVASILLGAIIWWGFAGYDNGEIIEHPKGIYTAKVDAKNDKAEVTSPDDERAKRLEKSFNSDSSGLAEAETQANSLIARTDDPTSSIFMTEAPQ